MLYCILGRLSIIPFVYVTIL